ncbi:neurocalcin homolog [Saccostrea echinata]|uniref:neurocalcin homolog n=1 Tax=Saccostrea echinata TaxID=191078 RepID=UPI002A804268|nr:neurocalcin homolog [Saccostrea echinata]
MGKNSSTLRPETLEDLKTQTKFSNAEILEWYKGFRLECPSGELSIEEFRKLYRSLFPNGNAEKFAEHVFRAFDENRDGTLDFREFMCALSVSSRGTVENKARMAFKIYDLDRDGFITESEMTEILKAMNKMTSSKTIGLSPEEKTREIFLRLDKNQDGNLSMSEFIKGVQTDSSIMRILTCASDTE